MLHSEGLDAYVVRRLGLPFREGLVKNRYIGRTFIQPDDRLRQRGVALKYNTLSESLRGKRIVLVDDSIVRGTTSGPIVSLLRQAGAAEIHMRVASPPITWALRRKARDRTNSELSSGAM